MLYFCESESAFFPEREVMKTKINRNDLRTVLITTVNNQFSKTTIHQYLTLLRS